MARDPASWRAQAKDAHRMAKEPSFNSVDEAAIVMNSREICASVHGARTVSRC